EEPENLTVLPIAGVAYFSLEEYNKAFDTFEKINALGDDSYAVHYYLGKCAQKFGLKEREEREFVLAWERDSTDVGVALTIARLKGDRHASDWESWYERALNKLLPSPQTLETTGAAYQSYAYSSFTNERFDLCIQLYKTLLEYRPKYYAAYYMIAQCYEYKYEYKTALSWYKKAQKACDPNTKGREIADAGVARVQAELFMIGD
nr:tetratricopeptide repeat protein [Bacteroidales bacterium]